MTATKTAGTVPALFDHTVTNFAARPAITDERGSVTFSGLSERVARSATVLANAGIGGGHRVGILLPNSIELVECLLAALGSGAAAVPINPSARAAEVRRIAMELGLHALISSFPVSSHLASDGVGYFAHDGEQLTLVRPYRGQRGRAGAPVPDDPALVAYSSGTTAAPHAVVRTHANLWWEAENFWSATRLHPSDVILGVVPLTHAHGLGNALLASLRSGARLILRARFLRSQTLDILASERVSVFPTVPFMVRMLETADRRRTWDLSALRLCFSAGAVLPREVFDAFRARFGVAVRQLYGLTEAGSVALNTTPEVELDPLSAGRPLGSVEITIEDAQGREVPAGSVGEIVVRSPASSGGSSRPLHTRDQGRWSPRGELVVTGRTSLFINTGANKVDPLEVEAALRLHPAVADVVVFGVPAPHGEQLVAAVVVPRGECSSATLRAHCKTLLAAHKIPRVLSFRTSLPRSPLGKVLIGRLIAEV